VALGREWLIVGVVPAVVGVVAWFLDLRVARVVEVGFRGCAAGLSEEKGEQEKGSQGVEHHGGWGENVGGSFADARGISKFFPQSAWKTGAAMGSG
jgi:hypothetical protein